MTFEDQFPYPYEEHFRTVPRLWSVKARLQALFDDTVYVSYCNHVMPLTLPGTDRPDLYTLDAWDEGGVGDQLLPSVGDQIADYLVNFEDHRNPIHHLIWRGYVWTGETETWEPWDDLPHQYMANLHVAFLPEEDDDETDAPDCPDLNG